MVTWYSNNTWREKEKKLLQLPYRAALIHPRNGICIEEHDFKQNFYYLDPMCRSSKYRHPGVALFLNNLNPSISLTNAWARAFTSPFFFMLSLDVRPFTLLLASTSSPNTSTLRILMAVLTFLCCMALSIFFCSIKPEIYKHEKKT